jgi:hypothetical protein
MSYRNPQQTLNRSAGKLYGDVAQSITSGMQQLSSAYRVDQAAVKQNRDEINAMIEKANNQKILFDTTLNQAYQDAGVWFDQENKDRLSEEANQVSLLMQKSVKTPEEMQRISNFMGSADVTKKDFETFGTLLSTLENDLKNGGKEGGVSNSQYSDRLKRARAFAGLDGGKVTVNTDLSKAGGPNNMYTWTSNDGKTTYTMDSKELRNIESKPGLGMYNVIPQYTETFTGFGNEVIKGLGNKANFTNVVAKEIKDQNGKVVATQYVRKFNEKGFYDAIKPQMQGQADAYINSDAQSFVTMYNHMIARNPEKFSNVEEISPAIDIKKINELKPKLVEMMSYNALKLQGNKDIIVSTKQVSEGNQSTSVSRALDIMMPVADAIKNNDERYLVGMPYDGGEIKNAKLKDGVAQVEVVYGTGTKDRKIQSKTIDFNQPTELQRFIDQGILNKFGKDQDSDEAMLQYDALRPLVFGESILNSSLGAGESFNNMLSQSQVPASLQDITNSPFVTSEDTEERRKSLMSGKEQKQGEKTAKEFMSPSEYKKYLANK